MISEFRRKFIHISVGSLFILLVLFSDTITALKIIFSFYIAGLLISLMISRGFKFPFVHPVLNGVQRKTEKHLPGKGALYFFLGACLTLAIFSWNKEIVLAALCAVVYGDGFATIIGIKFGKHEIVENKSVEGTLACFIACAIFLHAVYPFSIFRVIFVAFVATMVELLPIDDNLGMPLATAATLLFLL